VVLIRQSTNPVTLIANDRYRVDQPVDLKDADDYFGSQAAGRLGRTHDRNRCRRVFGRITDAALNPRLQALAPWFELMANEYHREQFSGPTRARNGDAAIASPLRPLRNQPSASADRSGC
jgi:hypothetical protein